MPDEDARLTDFLPDDDPDADGGDDGDEPDGSDGSDGRDRRDRSDEPDGSDVPDEPDEPVAPDADGDDGSDARAAAGDTGDHPGTVDDAEPAVETAAWHPDGAACDVCGAVVQRRWRDGGGLVCVDCVEW